MTPESRDLDVLGLPLHGSHLIEASAGSGKTWNIALLYVRLVLGAPPGQQGLPALDARHILVVTYTDAATQELRSRIHARLRQAAHVMQGVVGSGGDDAALAALCALRDRYPAAQWPALAARLDAAAQALDEAPISTIHGWCQRILREHALLSGEPFALNVLADTTALLQQCAQDWWRVQVQPLPPELASAVAAVYPYPRAVLQAVEPLLQHAPSCAAALPGGADTPLAVPLQHVDAQRRAALHAIKAPLPALVDDAERVLTQHGLIKALSQPHHVRAWFGKLRHWATDPDDANHPLTNTARQRLTLAQLQRGAATLPTEVLNLNLWPALQRLEQALRHLPDVRGTVVRHAAAWIDQRMRAQLRQQQSLTYDEMLRRVDEALSGPHGPALAARLRQRQPAALVDEFQDTDPRQWRILRAIYQPERAAPDTALLLIGDPKQAIYAFRHADIHSYLQARRACGPRVWRLGTNHRSSEAMVRAVNALFTHAEHQSPDGAFGFGGAGTGQVPFVPVQPSGLALRWCEGGHDNAPALTLALPPSGDAAPHDTLAQACAATVARWLTDPHTGLVGADGQLHRLQPGQIAILVNEREEAQRIGRALRRHGLPSAYRSERAAVWATPQAEDLALWLQACARPHDRDAVAHALLAASTGMDTAEVHTLLADELGWEQTLQRFAHYHALWLRHGVLAAVRQLMIDHAVPARLLRRAGDAGSGRRALVNLLHLAEWLQARAPREGVRGIQTTLTLLQQARRGLLGGQDNDASAPQVRLDSDGGAITLITVHKAKGLEFDVVLLPFGVRPRPLAAPKSHQFGVVRWHDTEGHLHVTLSDEGDAWSHALQRGEHERQLEDVRKLYVALTRARHATWAGIPLDDVFGVSAWARVLGLPGHHPVEHGTEAITEALDRLVGHSGGTIAWCPTDAASPMPTIRPSNATPPPPAYPHQARARATPTWWIASYSALTRAAADPGPPPEAAADHHAGDDDPTPDAHPTTPADPAVGAAAPWHRWPRGAQAGVVLHALLQHCAEQRWAPAASDAATLQPTAQRLLAQHGWPADRQTIDAADLAVWAVRIVQRPLPLPGAAPVALAQLERAWPEVGFWLPIGATVPADTLDRRIAQHVLPGQPRPALSGPVLHGMLKGYIDLIFAHDGRYWVLDHKSNALGDADDAYHPAALQAEVLRQRYDAQAALYLLALHRLLRQRLPDYDPAQHLGGALCVFWRGVAHATAGVWSTPAPLALLDELDALLQSPAETTA
ncbi:exodeoxyribonuclease V subunit beta [Tepidimonas aquatica]|uniref:RecBCD enzyme subunit RecB n=1 Tax=Tepidimonas aquatica TaxID=247482 RepID=A0A554WPN7_9BURK|nr:exodeoxyribonuclease V subunit beta [Tepidimonas aquatica]TSE25548.1 RecBCD enzyme subunit RecB [Tepidimonas aquatica]